jgi:RNA recognition motif-containing protein
MYVGNLPFETTEDEVRQWFEEYGEIESVAMITDRDSGRFRGFCFVEMENSSADAAIAALDGKEFGGRDMRVNEARPREDRGGGRNRGGNRDRNRYDSRSRYPDSGGGRW